MPMSLAPSFPRLLRLALAGFALLALGACGFHLKGATPLPFQSIYTNINLDSEFGARLRRTVTANSPSTRFTDRRQEADVYLHQIAESQNLRQLALDADGRVEEYELNLQFQFELLDRQGHVLLPPTTLYSVRELPYNDRIVQAKESEIDRAFKDMRNNLIDQILRRMSSPEVQAAYANAADRPIVPMPDDTVRSNQPQAGPASVRP
ncbi:LPS assembly lipoprotein LptE [Castellaniella ginsengisoli]|uniref:LPS-assembly lipoprotein LptE n=1 Tax=Castellaniella ginsengisoli TaxID=546114 RepID=A0AB39ESB7_9BURK